MQDYKKLTIKSILMIEYLKKIPNFILKLGIQYKK